MLGSKERRQQDEYSEPVGASSGADQTASEDDIDF
jgi:hypothetical protein